MRQHNIEQLLQLFNDYSEITNEIKVKLERNKFNTVNNKLYKYYSLNNEYTFSNLENDIIYLNNPCAFNDPFDCYLGYSYENYLQQFLLTLILEDKFQMSDEALETFTKFILNEGLNRSEQNFLNEAIKNYGDSFSITNAQQWLKKNLIQKLPLICNLLCDDGFSLAEEILSSCKTMSQIQNNLHSVIDSNFLVTCFSETYDNNLMWAHYADQNRGICVEYDMDKCNNSTDISYLKTMLLPVIYQKERPNIPIDILKTDKEFKYNICEGKYTLVDKIRYLLTKGIDWKYEREWRMILSVSNGRIQKFPLISKIYLGVNIAKDNEKRIQLLGDDKGVPIIKLAPSINEYKLVF